MLEIGMFADFFCHAIHYVYLSAGELSIGPVVLFGARVAADDAKEKTAKERLLHHGSSSGAPAVGTTTEESKGTSPEAEFLHLSEHPLFQAGTLRFRCKFDPFVQLVFRTRGCFVSDSCTTA